jgi:hypothetical protein
MQSRYWMRHPCTKFTESKQALVKQTLQLVCKIISRWMQRSIHNHQECRTSSRANIKLSDVYKMRLSRFQTAKPRVRSRDKILYGSEVIFHPTCLFSVSPRGAWKMPLGFASYLLFISKPRANTINFGASLGVRHVLPVTLARLSVLFCLHRRPIRNQ